MTDSDTIADGRLPSVAFRRACRQAAVFTSVEQALLVSDQEEVAGDLTGDPILVRAVAEHVRRTCDKATPGVQIQYAQVGERRGGRLLYVRWVDHYLLTLVAPSNTALGSLRRVAKRLVESLRTGNTAAVEVGQGRAAAGQPEQGDGFTYAIAWRPVEPLPKAIRKIIRDSAQQLALREGCQLDFIGVASDHVHLVLRCPWRRRGAWAASVFKRGIEEDISQRYGMRASLWQKGFLADPSNGPIDGEALLAYLNN